MSIIESTDATKLTTLEEFLAIPDDGKRRDLLDGVVYVWGDEVTTRNRDHSRTEARIAQRLMNWLDSRHGQRGQVVSGEAGFRLRRVKDSLVGVDVAYVSAEVVERTEAQSAFFDGPPVLAVEILSPSDEQREVATKVKKYLAAGTVVWVVDTDLETVRVHRPGTVAEIYSVPQEIDGEPYLPGFRVPVASLFA